MELSTAKRSAESRAVDIGAEVKNRKLFVAKLTMKKVARVISEKKLLKETYVPVLVAIQESVLTGVVL